LTPLHFELERANQNTLGFLKIEIEAQIEARYREEGDEEDFVHVSNLLKF